MFYLYPEIKMSIQMYHPTLPKKGPDRWSIPTLVLYMSSGFWLLGVESRDFPQTEKERTACKADQIHKMTTVFTQNGPRFSF